MADKNYKLSFNMTDGTTQEVQFSVPSGETPKKGIDYFTEEDKEEFLNDVEAVRYVEQTLTEEQQAQARENIGMLEPLIGTTDDITPAQVLQAIQSGRNIMISCESGNYGTLTFTSFHLAGSGAIVASSCAIDVQGAIINASLSGHTIDNTWICTTPTLVKQDDIPEALSDLADDANHRLVTDAEKAAWNAKSNFSGNYNDLSNKPTIPSISGLATETYVNTQVSTKVDKVTGKGLSTNDYTSADKEKLDYTNIAYGTCSTAADVAEKAVVLSGNTKWSLNVGSIIMVKFDVSNTAENVKINVNNTGAYPIWYNNAEYTGTGTAYTGYANRTITYMFDGAHYVWITASYDANSTYTNAALGQGYATCSTAAATTAKVGSLSSYKLVTGGIVAVKFTNAVPANATLNINSTGAKSIYFRGAKITADVIKAGDVATFVYSSYYHLISIDRWQNDISTIQNQISGLATTDYVDNKVADATPIKGVNYWTEADKDEIIQEILSQIGNGSVIGEVDSNNNILITSALSNGTYTIRYEKEDGSTIDIGTFIIEGAGGDTGPSYTNLADPTSADWLTNKRINSSKNVVDVTEAQRGDKTVVTTNKISISGVKNLHIKGLDIISNLVNGSSTQNYGRQHHYNASGELIVWQLQPSSSAYAQYFTTADYDSSVTIVDLPGVINAVGYINHAHVRLGGILTGTAEDVIITADEKIV